MPVRDHPPMAQVQSHTGQSHSPSPAFVFHWQSGLYAIAAIVFAFFIPGIALCKVVPLSQIAMAIGLSTLLAGIAMILASRSIEARNALDPRADYLLQASIFVIAAGLLWVHFIFQDVGWRERTIHFWPGLFIAMACGIGGALLLRQRQARLTAARDADA